MGRPVVHFEIGCKDSAKTQEFYKKLFDWKIEAMGPAAMIAAEAGGITGHITADTRGAVMNSISRIRILTISIVLVLCVPLWAERQEKTAEKPTAASVAPALKPGAAEMGRLKFYLGEWEYTETYPKSGFSPTGGKNTGGY